jgi:hypothetical protein
MTPDTARATNLRKTAPARAAARRDRADYVIAEWRFLTEQGVPFDRIAEQLQLKRDSLAIAIARYERREG